MKKNKLTKTEINRQLMSKNGFWNSIKKVGNVRVCRVCWDNEQWKVIDEDVTFKDVTNYQEYKDRLTSGLTITRRRRTYKPIKEFYYKQDLVNYVYLNQ